MKSKLLTLSVIVLAIFSVFTYVQSISYKDDLKKLASVIETKTNKVIVYEGKDGYTPVLGLDYFNGKDGLNAMSYSITQTVVKEVPLMGTPGKSAYELWIEAGNTGTLEDFFSTFKGTSETVYINETTGDLEKKTSNAKFPEILIPCNRLQVGCPEV